ncbi:hypothetical protein [Mucilaginibacter pocheonensis]|uniref:Sialate O-acetylesterase domain-containing protein n=1 Tax=Mucilaginibacter pocheonensis TaxID=398050 RepID=A0ABU1TFF4_9SPHI|nr:hypothetical protein [Mucilaginibacter pocheonensis]MDR6944054.1 hypothetical protein [Mucilaginibacter pocheonensis]
MSLIFLLVAVLQVNLLYGQNKYQDPENSIYQYSVPVESRTAYLWIPPKCKQVRGVIISLANLLERQWLEDPIIRKEAADDGLGIIWVGPAVRGVKKDMVFTADMKNGAGELLEKMLKNFADMSGYSEIEFAPIISMGHSANGQFAWEVPNWKPERTIAAIPVKTMPLPAKLNFKGVPLCYVVGETTEWPQYRVFDPATKPGDRDFFWPVVISSAVELRKLNEANLISVVVDPGGGHFDWSEHLAKYISLFIHKACKYRLPENQSKNGTVALNKIDVRSGWLTDTAGMKPDRYVPTVYTKYKGDPKQAFWFFDKETAIATAAFSGDRKVRNKQMLTFVQDDKLLPVAKLGFAPLKFEPEANGITFKVKGAFLTEVPPELIGSGTKLGHAPGPINFKVISGPAIQTGPDQFQIRFNRGGDDGAVWLQEEHPGNDKYRHAVQPGRIQIPVKLQTGESQQITFPEIPAQHVPAKGISLKAYSTSKLPVDYYVAAGPAIIEGDLLKIKQVPVNSKYPIIITVVANQWGRSLSPQYQSAQPVTRSFLLHK